MSNDAFPCRTAFALHPESLLRKANTCGAVLVVFGLKLPWFVASTKSGSAGEQRGARTSKVTINNVFPCRTAFALHSESLVRKANTCGAVLVVFGLKLLWFVASTKSGSAGEGCGARTSKVTINNVFPCRTVFA
jgi:hypothetical protein